MKKVRLIMAVLGVALLGLLALPHRAQAQTPITCTAVSGTSSWPYGGYTQYCGAATSSNGSTVAGVLYGILSGYSNAGTKLASQKPPFWVFESASEFSNSSQTGYCNLNPAKFGYASGLDCPTLSSPGNTINTGTTPQYTVLLVSLTTQYEPLNNATAHELGHWLDPLYASALSGTGRASDTTKFNSELTQDWTNLNNRTNYQPCTTPGEVFNGHVDSKVESIWICAGNATATISGTPTAGNVFKITTVDTSLTGGQQAVTYTVLSSDTQATIATGLASAINANSNLSSHHISATASGNVVTIVSATGQDTTGSASVTGNTEGINLTQYNLGGGPALSFTYASKSNNEAVLQAAWQYFFDPAYFSPSTNKELWAEEVAYITGYPDTGIASVDVYFKNEQFSCTQTVINSLLRTGILPGHPGSPYTFPSGQSCPAI